MTNSITVTMYCQCPNTPLTLQYHGGNPCGKLNLNFSYVFGGGQTGGIITTTCIGHVTEIYELVCVLMLLTKESHACG